MMADGFIRSVPADTVSGNAVKGEICFRSKLGGSLKTQSQVLPSLMTRGRHPDSTSFINDKPNFQTQLTEHMHQHSHACPRQHSPRNFSTS
jgi:hypothetical protein